jgi:hypothetical protein
LAVNEFPLFVEHVVILQQMFADIKVPLFHLVLGPFDSPVEQGMIHGHITLHARPGHKRLHVPGTAAEQPHQFVVH